jgi:hypothetical protein
MGDVATGMGNVATELRYVVTTDRGEWMYKSPPLAIKTLFLESLLLTSPGLVLYWSERVGDMSIVGPRPLTGEGIPVLFRGYQGGDPADEAGIDGDGDDHLSE